MSTFSNLTLILVVLGLLFVMNTRRLESRKKIIACMVLLSIGIVYTLYPKEISACGVLPNGTECFKIKCIGIPSVGIGNPFCYGKQVGPHVVIP
jgi:hypothetical protein